jgi:hypothetical protein
MIKSTKPNRKLFFALGLAAIGLCASAVSLNAEAREPAAESSKVPACAVIEHFSGSFDVLDASRNHIYDSGESREIPCGGWVSVDQGWVLIHHRRGYQINLSSNTLVQLPEPSGRDGGGDALVLFKGQAFVHSAGGMGELKMVTPNGRGRISQGEAVFVYDADAERTQLIALDGTSTLENRFVPSKRTALKPGQATMLDFTLLRVVPTVPRAVPAVALQEHLTELRVAARDQEKAIAEAIARRQETFVPAKKQVASTHQDGDADVNRDLASERKPASVKGPDPEAEMLKHHLVNRLVAGEPDGEHILNPNSYAGPTQKAKLKVINVEDPAAPMNKKEHLEEEAEKQRLIRELTTLKLE